MLKKIVLSTLLAVSTLASAQLNLDLGLIISHDGAERQSTGSVVVNENEETSVVFNGLETLVVNVTAQTNDELVTIKAQFFQRTEETEELTALVDPLEVEVPLNQPATFTINEQDNSGTLLFVVTPSLITE